MLDVRKTLSWCLCVGVGILLGTWLEADLIPVECKGVRVNCPDPKCRSTASPEECYFEQCEYGVAEVGNFVPHAHTCCNTRSFGCCDIPVRMIKCMLRDRRTPCPDFQPLRQTCSEHKPSQNCEQVAGGTHWECHP
jgi:hypothetical protein